MSTQFSEETSRRGLRVGHYLALTLLLLVAVVTSGAEPPREVFIANFPEQQVVKGSVTVDTVIPHTRMVRFEDNVVSPVNRSEYTNLREVGQLDSSGFSTAVVSLVGEVKGSAVAGGKVGLLLLPDEEPILQAFRDHGETLLAIELKAEIKTSSVGVFSAKAVQQIAFPRYRLFFYNEGSNSVEANAYVYLRH